MKISVLHPSYGRPGLARGCYEEWMVTNADQPGEIEYILCLSAHDDANIEEYRRVFADTKAVILVVPERGLVRQVNLAAAVCEGDLLVAVSDDFGCPKGWDTILRNKLAGKVYYAVKTQDGLQPFIMTLPIMDRAFYERWGYIYHPEYEHMYGDEELAVVADMLGCTVTLPDLFEHRHYTTGKNPKDDVNKRNDSFYGPDGVTYRKRKEEDFGIVVLSILIPTIPARSEMLAVLQRELQRQIEAEPEGAVELLINDDAEMTIGAKRNALMDMAKGEYVCFIDDDDQIAPNYVELILTALEKMPDCCNLNGIMTTDGTAPQRMEHSVKHKGYYGLNGVLCRPPNHLNVIRRGIAARYRFANSSWGEDTDQAMRMCRDGVLQNEAIIEDVLYYYQYRRNKIKGT